MIGCRDDPRPEQGPRDELREASRRCVDQRLPHRAPRELAQPRESLAVVAHALNQEDEVRPIERCDDDVGLRHAQHAHDLGARVGRGAARHGERDRVAEQVAVLAEPVVNGAELIAPLNHAVGLIHGQERHAHSVGAEPWRERRQALRRAVEQPHLSGARRRKNGAPLVGAE